MMHHGVEDVVFFLGAVMQKTKRRCRNASSRAFAKASAKTGDVGRNSKMPQAKERCDRKEKKNERMRKGQLASESRMIMMRGKTRV